jgi:hypothetical protein
MTMQGDDEDDADLRQAFAVLRREEAKAAPTFEALRSRAHGGPRRLAPLGGLLVAAAAAAAILGIVVRRPDPPPPMASMEQWIAPTDFLLDTPGRDIVRTVPRIGGSLDSRSVSP